MASLQGLGFGAGQVYCSPIGGNLAANPTPLEVGVVQNSKLSLGADIVELFGQYQWSVDSAVAKRTASGTIEFAQMSNSFLGQMYAGDSVAAGVVKTQSREAATVPAVTTYTVTVAHSTTFLATDGDRGVVYQATSVPLTRVAAGSEALGKYSVSAGAYTFSAADASAAVYISYKYTDTTMTTLTVNNHVQGWGPIISLDLVYPYEGAGIGFYFPNVRLGKIDVATKHDGYTMLTTDFKAFSGGANTPFTCYQAW